MDEAAAQRKLLDLADDGRGAALGVAVRLGLFAALAGGRRTVAQLARGLGADEEALEVVADALVALGLLEKDGPHYANAELSAACLVPGTAYLGDRVVTGCPRAAVTRLLRAVREGPQPAPSATAGLPRALSRALYRDAQVLGQRLAQSLDLTRSRHLLDVGGGLGGYAAAFCDAWPELSVTVFDLPGVVREGRRLAGPRLEFVSGDFLRDPLPRGCDVVLASDILHGQRAPDAVRLVRLLHEALEPGGLLVLRDVLMDGDRTGPRWAALFSLTLLATSGSRCYAEDEVRGWLAEAGFVDVREAAVESEPWDPNRVLLAMKG